jgi:carboxymethylenebutenolidase
MARRRFATAAALPPAGHAHARAQRRRAFYGNSAPPEEAAKVKAPLLVHLAAVDERINAAWPAHEAALKAAGARATVRQYPGTQHGFNNDTTPRYDAAAAKLAWDRTVAFFKANL